MKRLLSSVFVLLLCLSVFGCSKKNSQGFTSLNDAGERVVGLIEKMVLSEAYAEMMIGRQTRLEEIISGLKETDYTKPSAVYEIKIPAASLMEKLAPDADSLPDELKDYITKSASVSFVSQINAATGTDCLSASAVLTASVWFVNGEVSENTVYLYTFEDSYPIAVVFIPDTDGAVRASGSFILNEKFKTADINAVEDAFGSVGFGEAECIPLGGR